MSKVLPAWSVPVAIHEVPESGRSFDLVADENARALLAQALGLRSLQRLEASFDVTRHGTDGLHVVGQVSASVGQTCVVTLEPIDSEIVEAVDLVFEPRLPALADEDKGSRLAADDAREPLIGGVVDLGVIATEFLTLGIDPYPRKPGAVFEMQTVGADSGHPFAALAALKKEHKGSS